MNDLWELAPIAGQIELRLAEQRQIREAVALLPPLVIHSTGNDVERELLVGVFKDPDQPIRFLKRQRLEQYAAHHCKHRHICADAQRHHQNRNG